MRHEHTIGTVLLLGLATGLTGCNNTPKVDEPEPAVLEPPPRVEDVVEEPLSFYGKSVTLAGEVDTVFSSRAFELEGNEWLFDHEILVVTRTPIALGVAPLEDDDRVVVSGTIERLTVAEFEKELGWDPSSVEFEVEIEQVPVLVADSIHTTTHVARWSEKDDQEGVILGPAVPLATALAESLYGRRAELTRAEVRSVTSKGLWVGPSHRMQTFVSAPEGFDLSAVEPGERVTVHGYYRQMPPADDAIARWGLDPALRTQLEQEMVFIDATTVEVIDPVPLAAVTLAEVLGSPALHAGRVIHGEAKVLSVPSDRGFWLDAGDDKRVFAVIHEDDPEHAHIDIDAGDVVKFTGLVLRPHQKSDLVLPLEEDAKEAIDQSGVFINIHWSGIEKVGAV